MAGLSQTQADINARAGAVALSVRQALEAAVAWKAFLDTKTTANLTTLGFTQSEVDVLKSAATDLYNLSQIAHAQGTQASPSDFFAFARQLTGTL